MRTTIAVQPETIRMLKRFKAQYAAHTYDETLLRLMQEGRPKESLRGSLKGVRAPFVREKRDRLDR